MQTVTLKQKIKYLNVFVGSKFPCESTMVGFFTIFSQEKLNEGIYYPSLCRGGNFV